MPEILGAALLGFFTGAIAGSWAAFAGARRMFLSLQPPPAIELKADDRLLDAYDGVYAIAWADRHGLVMMPKGKDFQPKAKQ